MALVEVHPWAQFFTGMLIGCWIGAVIGCAGVLLLMGRRIRQLEGINLILRRKLRARRTLRQAGAAGSGPMLVMPGPDPVRRAELPIHRIARVN